MDKIIKKTKIDQCARCRMTKIPVFNLFIMDDKKAAKKYGIEMGQNICRSCLIKLGF
jgi:hypothetical protein